MIAIIFNVFWTIYNSDEGFWGLVRQIKITLACVYAQREPNMQMQSILRLLHKIFFNLYSIDNRSKEYYTDTIL